MAKDLGKRLAALKQKEALKKSLFGTLVLLLQMV
jgi:hypothetical protein